jgi:hypothetical protein
MSEQTIKSLQEALKHSPENTPLRMLLADTLLSLHRWDEAEAEYTTILKRVNSRDARMGLARVYYAKGSYSACNVILEEIIESGGVDIDVYLLHARALLKRKFFCSGYGSVSAGTGP